MEEKEFKNLDCGDVVQGRASGISYIVQSNYRDAVIAVRTVHMTNSNEWYLISKAKKEV